MRSIMLLYNIVLRKYISVASVMSHFPLPIIFRRTLTGNKWTEWLHLYQRLMTVQLNEEPDRFVWKRSTTGSFRSKLCMKTLLMVFLGFSGNIYGRLKY